MLIKKGSYVDDSGQPQWDPAFPQPATILQLCETLVDKQDETIANLKEDFREMLTKALEKPKLSLDEDDADDDVCFGPFHFLRALRIFEGVGRSCE